MEMVNKVESLIFKQVLHYPVIQVIQNKIMVINDQCYVDHFCDDNCVIHTPHGQYLIEGTMLRIKEYGDYVLRIESEGIKKIEIVGDKGEK
ncbi:MAG: hypothetical protein ACRCST_00500 [Turicibacter sp.]